MGDDVFGMEIPADQLFDQLLHAPDGADPRTVDRFLIVNDVGRGVEGDLATFTDHDHAAPLAGGANGGGAGFSVGRAIDCALDAVAAGEVANLLNVFGARAQHVIAEA